MHTRVPYDPEYTALVGTAVYVFAYYEWAIIYLIQRFSPGFVHRYARGAPMISGAVKRKLEEVLADPSTQFDTVSRSELQSCLDEFTRLVDWRNALIHAHPITDRDGSQILSYQASVGRPVSDVQWPVAEVEAAIQAFDDAACSAGQLLHRVLK